MIERQQHKRWPNIEPHVAEPVKDATDELFRLFLAQLAFPIVAVAADARYAGVACLSARLTSLRARSVSFRDCSTDSAKIRLVLTELERVFRDHAPVTIVVESSLNTQLDRAARAIPAVASESAREHGLRVRTCSVARAAQRFAPEGDATLQRAARGLMNRFPALRERLAPGGRVRLRDSEHWRQHRALTAAFCLANDAACDALSTAVGGSIVRPRLTQP